MTIRLWLELANCWRCSTSLQLSEAQVAAVRELLAPATPEPVAVPVPSIDELLEPLPDSDPDVAVAPLADRRRQELDRLTQSNVAAQILRNGFRAVPAWLVSFMLHLILILLLALVMLGRQELPPTITLSTFFLPETTEGGEIRIENRADQLQDDLAMAHDLAVDQQEIRDVLQQAEQDALELRVDRAPLAQLPDLDTVKANITTRQGPLMSFAARDPRVRAEIVYREGGTSLTEAAVSRGLRWLASVQNQDGSWSLAQYERHDQPGNQGDVAGTSLALLPFLGAGQTHEFGKYKETVAKGLAWLLKHQKPTGDLRANFAGDAGMYAHGQAAIVLCEAYAMTGDQRFKRPAQKAIDFIQQAQHIRGGWRYQPGQAGDTSVLGWQLMALQSGRAPNLGLAIDDNTLRLADLYLSDAAWQSRKQGVPTGALYQYQPQQRKATPAMTAEALLCRMYLGWNRNDPRLMAGVRWLVEENLPSYDKKNLYYWYYGTQLMHHYGGPLWDRWNRQVREILVATQEKKGARAGSWNPSGFQWGSRGGRIYTTSLSVCSLEVYYRHLPLFKQIEFDQAE
ncbi:MAG: terpene cyclase/mutase family protein, partial [Phycisphaerales bacterium]|nr:terpene cyclase/mutase family protein [Phycisphaerales bacterium]